MRIHLPNVLLSTFLFAAPAFAAAPPKTPETGPPTFAKATAGLEKKAGMLTVYVDRRKGKVWLEVPSTKARDGEVGSYIYQEGIVSGLGSNPVGLDRGQIGDARIVTLRRVGGRLLIEQPNLRFRALSEDPAERQAVLEAEHEARILVEEAVDVTLPTDRHPSGARHPGPRPAAAAASPSGSARCGCSRPAPC